MHRHRIFATNLTIQIEQPDIETGEEGEELEGAYRDEKNLPYATIAGVENQKKRKKEKCLQKLKASGRKKFLFIY